MHVAHPACYCLGGGRCVLFWGLFVNWRRASCLSRVADENPPIRYTHQEKKLSVHREECQIRGKRISYLQVDYFVRFSVGEHYRKKETLNKDDSRKKKRLQIDKENESYGK